MAYSYFAFLDVMGYRFYLNQDQANGTEIFKQKLITSYRVFEQINIGTLQHKSISDSIFMNSTNSIVDFLEATKNVFISFLENGLLIRGGIAYNKHFQSDHITYSHALTDAYQLESTKSIFPRILIHSSVIGKLENESTGEYKTQDLKALKERNLILHCGEHYQLNILDNDNWRKVFNASKAIFMENRSHIEKDPKLLEYHIWLHNYIMHFKPRGQRTQGYIEAFQPLT